MKKSRINALLAAGCVAFLAPAAANATTYTNITTDTTLTENSTFTGITPGANNTVNINTGASTLLQPGTSGGTITLQGNSTINFTDAVANISLNASSGSAQGTTTVTGANNTIHQGHTTTGTYGSTSIGNTTIFRNGSLTLDNDGGNSMNATSVTLGAASGGTSGGATLVIDGDSVVTVTNGVSVVGTNNAITNNNNSSSTNLGNVSINANAGATLTNVSGDVSLSNEASPSAMTNHTLGLNNAKVNSNLQVNSGHALEVTTSGSSSSDLTNIVSMGAYGTNNGSTVTLNTSAAGLNGNQIQMNGYSTVTVNGTNLNLSNGIQVSGEGNILTNTNSGNLGNVALTSGAKLAASGLTATNSTLSYGNGTEELNLTDSTIAAPTLNQSSNQKVTINAESGTNIVTGNTSISNGAQLTYCASPSATLNASLGGSKVSVSDGKLITDGTGTVNVGPVELTGGTLEVKNGSIDGVSTLGSVGSGITASSGTSLGTISVGANSTAVVSGIDATSGGNTTGFTLANLGTISSDADGNILGDLSITTGNTNTVASTAGTATVGTVTLGATSGSSSGSSTLNLNTNGNTSFIDIAQLDTVGSGNKVNIGVTVPGANEGTVTITTTNLSGTSTEISNDTTTAANLVTVDYGTGATGLTTSGPLQIGTLDAGARTAQTTMSNSGDVQIGKLEIAKGYEFVLTSTGNTTTIDEIQKDGSGSMNLNLYANGGAIAYSNSSGDALEMAAGDNLTLRGANAITIDNGISVTGTGATISNSCANTNLNDINVGANDSLSITASATTNAGKISLTAGSASSPATQVSLNANSGIINAEEVALKGNSTLALSGSRAISLEEGKGVSISGAGNTISNSGTGSRALRTITMGNGTNPEAEVSVSNLTAGTHFDGFDFSSEDAVVTNKINAANSQLGALDIATPTGASTDQTLTVTTTTGNSSSSFTTSNMGAGTSLTLNNAVGSLSGTSVTMNGNNTLSATNTSLSTGVNVNGTGNSISADSASNLRKITMGSSSNPSANAGVAVNGLTYGNGSGTSNFTGFTFNANNNTVDATGSKLGALNLDASQSLSLKSTSGANEFTTATLEKGSSATNRTGLTLGVDSGSLSGSTVVLKGNSLVTVNQNPTLTTGIYAADTNNNISVTNASSGARLGTLYMGDNSSDTVATAGVVLSNLKAGTGSGTNFDGINFRNAAGNIISANSSDLGAINTSSTVTDQTVSITGTSGTNNFTTANLASGTSLTLANSSTGTLSGSSVTMNGSNTLSTTAATSNGVHLDNVYVNRTGNTITPNNLNSNLGNIVLGSTADRSIDAGVTVSGLAYGTSNTGSTNNFTGFTFSANKNEILANGSSTLGALNLDVAGQELAVYAGENASTVFTTASLKTGSSGDRTVLTLDGANTGASMRGTSVDLNGYGTLNLNKATINGTVNVKGDNNIIGGTAGQTNQIASITFGEDNAKVAVSDVTATSGTNITKTGNEITTGGTTNLNRINVESGKEFTLRSTSGTTSVNIGDGGAATGLGEGATLNLATTNGNINIENLVMNGSSGTKDATVNISATGTGATDIDNLYVNSTENIVNNTTTGTISLDKIEYLADESTVKLNGNYSATNLNMASGATNGITTNGTVNVTNINQNGPNTLNTDGNLNFTNLVIDGSEFTLKSANGTVNFANIDDMSGTLNPNLVLDAASDATINKTTLTTLDDGDILRLQGTGNINLSGLRTSGNASVQVTNDNANLGATRIDANSTFNTSGDGVHDINVSSLDIQDPGLGGNPAKWLMDFDPTTKTADTIKITNVTDTGTMDFEIASSAAAIAKQSPFVKYASIITDSNGDTLDKSLLDTIVVETEDPEHPGEYLIDYYKVVTIGENNVYYSYISPDDSTSGIEDTRGSYLPNTIRITNYDIGSNLLMDLLTMQGDRSYATDDPEHSTYAILNNDNVSGLSLPNMEARAGIDNIATISGTGILEGTKSSSTDRSQLFIVDTTGDEIARTMNINGFTIQNGLSQNSAGRYNNSGNGAAIQILSDSAAAPATVNLGSFSGVNTTFKSNDAELNGGAVYNSGAGSSLNVDESSGADITITFDSNTAGVNGGALYNTAGAAANLTANNVFKSNEATEAGGAIYNDASDVTLGSNTQEKTHSFTENVAGVNGGAIYNNAGNITFGEASTGVEFTGNTANSSGGALYNNGGNIFLGGENTAVIFSGNSANDAGGAIYNTGDSLVSVPSATVFSANHATKETADPVSGELVISGQGGAIYNTNSALLNLPSNNAFSENSSAEGGAIYNSGNTSVITIGTAATDTTDGTYTAFENNVAYGNGGAINNNDNATLTIAGNGLFKRNIAKDASILSDATKTYAATTGDGGAIYNNSATLVLGDANSTFAFDYNEAFGNGGAIASVNNEATYNGDYTFVDNVATGNGGAYSATDSEISFTGSQTFGGNVAEGKGGAIYGNNAIINITANNPAKATKFSGNKQDVVYSTTVTDPDTQMLDPHCGHTIYYTRDDAGNIVEGRHVIESYDSNAVFLENASTLNLTTENGSSIIFKDKIASDETTGPNSIVQNGNVKYYNDMSGYAGSFSIESGNAYFTKPESVPFQNGDYKLNGGTLTAMKNGKIIPVHANSLDLSGTTPDNPAKMTIDLSLKSEKSDRFVLPEGETAEGNLLITDMNIKGSSNKDSIFYKIADGADVDSTQKKVDGEIYDYTISGGKGGLTFDRGDIHAPLVAPQVAVNARLAGQLDLFNNMLHRVDEIAETRYFNQKNKTNLYAGDPDVLDDRRIDNGYTPYVNQEDGGSAWMKPNFTIEKINPKGYHRYHNKAYSTILGYEAPVATLRNGWDLINTVFVGYQGSTQHYDDFRNYQNGGTAGYMANLYHKNFFSGGVVMLGGSAVQTHDKSGLNRDMNYGLFDVGASGRIGYNVGLGKHWLFQPMMTMSYIYISGVDRHNHRGQRINLKGTNTLQIAPGFKLVGNYGGWEPYLLFDYTWPCIAKTVANVNDIGIPDLKLRSYVEYGAGLRKNLGERFTGYAEAVMRNGGRTGVSIQGGLLFKF
ncbi:MAG: hypothetical protein K6A44_03775 [bacterium]|nr:hypothetical protein [bacterium]